MARSIDLLYRVRAAVERGRAGLSGKAALPSLPDDRFQARLALYLWVGKHCPGHRVLDLRGDTGYGAQSLRALGAERVVSVLDDPALRRYAARTYGEQAVEWIRAEPAESGSVFDLILDFDCAPGVPGEGEGKVQRAISFLSSDGHYVIARNVADGAAALESEEHWRGDFLRSRRWVLRPPEDYRPDWQSRAPARARAQEYRIEPIAWSASLPGDAISEIVVASVPRSELGPGPHRLHVGSGMEHMKGWINIDLEKLPGVDLVLDVARDFDFENVEAIYAEHFLEHLAPRDVASFLVAAHGALRDDGVIRLSTPSLDYVWQTLYQRDAPSHEKIERALSINRAFYGWGHRFIWNREILGQFLERCGFRDVEWPRYGESRWPLLRGIERHETYPDTEDLPHVLVVEARKGALEPNSVVAVLSHFHKEFEIMLAGWDWNRPHDD